MVDLAMSVRVYQLKHDVPIGTIISGEPGYCVLEIIHDPSLVATVIEDRECPYCHGPLVGWPNECQLKRLTSIQAGASGRHYGVFHTLDASQVAIGCPSCRTNFVAPRESVTFGLEVS